MPNRDMSEFFQEAYRRARSRYTREEWLALVPQQVTDVIYREMREMDAEARVAFSAAHGGGDADGNGTAPEPEKG